MIIGTEQNSIKQFFQDIGFLPPKGLTLDYFILPPGTNTDDVIDQSTYSKEDIVQNPRRGTTIVYQPKDTTKLYSNPKTVQDKDNLQPMPFTQGVNKYEPQDDGHSINVVSPEVKSKIAVVESTTNHIDIKLKEDTDVFPKGTFFHFKRI